MNRTDVASARIMVSEGLKIHPSPVEAASASLDVGSFQRLDAQIVKVMKEHPFAVMALALGAGYLTHALIKKISA